jgi:hypothetical protein
MILNETLIQQVIMGRYYRRSFVLPNYTPLKWWECDVFEITAAGYFREFEIKLNIADFRADCKKARGVLNKHELLSQGDRRGPSQFYYVTPKGLLFTSDGPQVNKDAILPPWAGLLEVGPKRGWLRVEEVVKAPRLHREKANPKIREKAEGTIYWRMHNLLQTSRLTRVPKQ